MKGLSCLIQRDCPVGTFRSWFLIGLVFLSCLALVGCGGGSGTDNNITVTVAPGEVTLAPGETQQFSAPVTGITNTAVTWSVDPQTGGGSITANGLYTAPAAVGTYYVVATSQADSTKFGKAKVNVVAGGGGGGHYYEGIITIERDGLGGTNNKMNYNEGATITNFKLIDAGNGIWAIQGSSTVTAHAANVHTETGARIDCALATRNSTQTTIMLMINSSTHTYDLAIGVWAEGTIYTSGEGIVVPAPPPGYPIAVEPILGQSLPADPSRITGTITQTQLANCIVTWDFIKK